MLRSVPCGIICCLIQCSLCGQTMRNEVPPGASSPSDKSVPLTGNLKETLREGGVDFGATYTHFGQGLVAGQGDHQWQFGGTLFANLGISGPTIGLWNGFSIDMVGQWSQGDNVNGGSGTLLPPNTAQAFPLNGRSSADLALTFTQRIGQRVSVRFGKFNMLDTAARTPLLGGGGLDSFWNVGLAAPISGLVPPYLVGASVSVSTGPAQMSFMIFDPRSVVGRVGLKGWGEDGVTGRFAVTFPAKLAGRSGYHTFTAIASSKTGLNLADIPELALPPESGATLGRKQGSYYVGYSVQQFLRQNPSRPGVGWGVFGQVGVADSNPNPLAWMVLAGVGGTGLLPGRPLDRFGSGYFRYTLSEDLTDGLRLLGVNLRAEQGWETFYNFAITPWFYVTADVQVVAPGVHRRETAALAGLRAQFRF